MIDRDVEQHKFINKKAIFDQILLNKALLSIKIRFDWKWFSCSSIL